MSAIPEQFLKKTAQLSADITRPFPNSKKIYLNGSTPDIRVPMREVRQMDTATQNKDAPEANPPIYIYDTSGPYTDPEAEIDLLKGLAPLREDWIKDRNDTELLKGPSSKFGRDRQQDKDTAHLRFEHIRNPRKARQGKNVSQMFYARQGIITPDRKSTRLNSSHTDISRMPSSA